MSGQVMDEQHKWLHIHARGDNNDVTRKELVPESTVESQRHNLELAPAACEDNSMQTQAERDTRNEQGPHSTVESQRHYKDLARRATTT